MPATPFAASQIWNFQFNGTVYVPPTDWYIGFRSAGVELSLFNYSRIHAPADSTTWPVITTSEWIMANGIQLDTPVATGGDWIQADEVGWWDDPAAGDLWFFSPLEFPFTLLNGRFRSFLPGTLRLEMI